MIDKLGQYPLLVAAVVAFATAEAFGGDELRPTIAAALIGLGGALIGAFIVLRTLERDPPDR